MPEPITALLVLLGAVAVLYGAVWFRHIRVAWKRGPHELAGLPGPLLLGIGFVTDFLDTWGIGSYATTTALFKFFKKCPDRLIPGTLNVGHGIPTIVQAFIFVAAVKVDPVTLISMIVAAVAGAWLGAGVVAGWDKRKIQIGMGLALAVAAVLLLRQQLAGDVKFSEDALGLVGGKFWIGVSVNFVLGALMTLGIGLYAPCMILVALLGMNADAAFPIMMGSCAFLMPIASYRFIQKESYAVKPAIALTIAGIPAVLAAVYLFKKTQIETIRWVVFGVVVYTSLMMLYSAFFAKDEDRIPATAGTGN